MDDLMMPQEVSARLRTKPETLKYWRYIGTGPRFARIGRRVVYRRSEVEAWLEEQFASQEGA